ncbi:MAG TPA: lipoprotein signal peptidase [Paludibacter sp.]|nr:lipoprotein signal peptidase [Paludibacter sp.]
MSITKKSILLIFLVLFVDQAVKVYIKLHFALGDHVDVFSWFQIFFIENNGMAFGMEIISKLFLTLFRIAAVVLLAYYIRNLIRKNARNGFILTVSLVLAGAAGNIIDSMFYGLIFDDSHGHIASFLPDGGGYASLFYGRVVDMLYFPIIRNSAGETIFFSPVFNIADSAISVAVVIILLFFRKELNESLETKKDQHVEPIE